MNILFVIHKYGVPLDDPCCYPLGAMYVSSVLKKNHNVKVLNYNLRDYDLEEESEGIDVALFTGFEEFYPYIVRDAAFFRKKGIKTVVGGALATFKSRLLSTVCDVVVVGECEGTIEQILESRGVVFGKSLPINDIPLPDYDGFGIAEYNERHKIKYMGVLTSRGCPHNCTFCSSTCAFRFRSTEGVLREVDTYVDRYGIEYVVFNDNTFNVNRSRATKIIDEMGYRGLKWSAALRLDNIDEEFCEAMAQSGCGGLIVGVESFSQKYLDQMNKGLRVEQITDALDLLHKYELPYYGNVLFGLNGQTDREIEEEVKKIPPQYNIFPCMVRPFVGTHEGRHLGLNQEDWDKWDRIFKEYITSKGKYCYPDLELAC